MVNVVGVTGAGARGAVGLDADATDQAGSVYITFAAEPWETQPGLTGTVTLVFGGPRFPARYIPAGGWAALVASDPVNGVVTIGWTAQNPPVPGIKAQISFGG